MIRQTSEILPLMGNGRQANSLQVGGGETDVKIFSAASWETRGEDELCGYLSEVGLSIVRVGMVHTGTEFLPQWVLRFSEPSKPNWKRYSSGNRLTI